MSGSAAECLDRFLRRRERSVVISIAGRSVRSCANRWVQSRPLGVQSGAAATSLPNSPLHSMRPPRVRYNAVEPLRDIIAFVLRAEKRNILTTA